MMNMKPDYEYKQISTAEISVDMIYQRDLNDKRVQKIVKEFNPYLVNACKISYRDGRFWVFDGQHTIAAIKRLHGGKDKLVECKVFYGLTRLDEMELFIAQNGASSAVSTREKFRALFQNGDPDITNMVRDCELCGVRIDFSHSKASNKIIAVSALYKCYGKLTRTQFMDMLEAIKEAWGGIQESWSGEILTGMMQFYKTYWGEFNRKLLIKRLHDNSTPNGIIRDGKSLISGGTTRYGKIILSLYNRNTSSKRLEDKF
jgi:hypothetical protein